MDLHIQDERLYFCAACGDDIWERAEDHHHALCKECRGEATAPKALAR